MAITDIITRIEAEAASEAAEAVGAARAEAARIIAAAESTVATERASALEEAERRARDEAETILATARLTARDELLARKRALAERVLDRAREALETLPDSDYLEFIAFGVARAARGDEILAIAAADVARLGGLAVRLEALGVRVTIASAPAPVEHGVVLTGDRVHVEVSPTALVADDRDRLLLVAARTLFGGEE